MELGIIGYGNFGQLVAEHLKKHFHVFVADKSNKKKQAQKQKVNFVSINEAASKKIVIISVPINQFENTLKRIRSDLSPDALVFDVCSVKSKPAKLMKRILPAGVEIIATHPLFGPRSAAQGIKGLEIVLCPIRTTRINQIKKFLEKLELKVTIMTPKEHDLQMAKVQALTHFIARSLVRIGIGQESITTKPFDHLLEVVNLVKDDSPQLFRDLQVENQFAAEIRENLIQEMIKIDQKIREKK
tara:strand:+ start:520 stop:1248 length:729 start_codon:yes stop_codon:yes gene_type:complete